ncbi:MAG: SDR family NAD(P)-dependent oxidoreductase [Mycobacterium sp.]
MELRAGQVAVVTGAASGIGLALAEGFAQRGLRVVLADVQADALEAAAAVVGGHGVETLAVRTDVSQVGDLEALAAATMERFGVVNVLCNNAGVASRGDEWFGPITGWEWVMGVNFWGVVHGVRAFLPHLAAAGSAHVVNTASIAGLLPGLAASYDASKHAVVAITENLYFAMADAGLPIGVSCLCPGWVRTSILDAERNWPSRLGPMPERVPGADIAQKYTERAIAEGMTPAAVAGMVIEAVEAQRYWVFPGDDFFELAVQRFHTVIEHADPVRPELPGMPPRAQIMAEVMAALGLLPPEQ